MTNTKDTNKKHPETGMMDERSAVASVIQQDDQIAEANISPRAKYNKFALVSIIMAAVAWVVLSFNGRIALGISVLSIAAGCVGLRAATRAWRNTAITAVLASAVLLVVVSAFLIVIFVGLNSV